MIEFILNDTTIATSAAVGTPLLDFIRYQQHLSGTKIGCREGDCGACTVLVGTLHNDGVHYQSMTSCITPLGNAQGKHIVTVEGLNLPQGQLNQVQQAMVNEGGTQCGFCTAGFVVSLGGHCLSHQSSDYSKALAAVDGNICRCTGYKSIERAIQTVDHKLQAKTAGQSLDWLVAQGFLPAYFTDIADRMQTLSVPEPSIKQSTDIDGHYIGGGTDLYVQKPEEMMRSNLYLMFDQEALNKIEVKDQRCYIGAASTVSDVWQSEVMQAHFPQLSQYLKLVSSTQIRNMGTIAGNLVNASPIGDLSIFLLALNATLVLKHQDQTREVPLRDFYKGYKILDKQPTEYVTSIYFDLPTTHTAFNFEKVSKRTHLDIASVNAAIQLKTEGMLIKEAHLSAGGVAPVPLYLAKAAQYLKGKTLSAELVKETTKIANDEVAPISDVRGTATYKRLLLRQLIYAHFITIFEGTLTLEDLV
ncbi:FAD binding domain-containing protein [uncultured Microscilla sp.]|uniref:FAD binding domain-containing protein n=1 Tax=uncultured Microscilla sp. TaxID=432653 RepID=UPI00263023B5|nr:FAD binding domain-containing protein [uncultured Microscilla sp.]